MAQEPQWQNRGARRPGAEPKEPPKPRDFVAEAKAIINAADQNPSVIAAVIVAQALDRFGKQVTEAAAISSYKRT